MEYKCVKIFIILFCLLYVFVMISNDSKTIKAIETIINERKKNQKEKTIENLQVLLELFNGLYINTFTNTFDKKIKYDSIIRNINFSHYFIVLVNLIKYHLDEQILILEDENLSIKDKKFFLNKNFNTLDQTIDMIFIIDKEINEEINNKERKYIGQRVSKHEELMREIRKDIEENKTIFVNKYSK